jgi:hypothetical protein
MGVGRAAIALLLEEAAARPFYGRLATLGRQTISATDQEVARLRREKNDARDSSALSRVCRAPWRSLPVFARWCSLAAAAVFALSANTDDEAMC